MDTNSTPSSDLAKKRDDLLTNATDDDAMLEHLMHEDEGDELEDLLEQSREEQEDQRRMDEAADRMLQVEYGE